MRLCDSMYCDSNNKREKILAGKVADSIAQQARERSSAVVRQGLPSTMSLKLYPRLKLSNGWCYNWRFVGNGHPTMLLLLERRYIGLLVEECYQKFCQCYKKLIVVRYYYSKQQAFSFISQWGTNWTRENARGGL